MTVEEIIDAIRDRSSHDVALGSGVAERAIINIKAGRVIPRAATLGRLEAWLLGHTLPKTLDELNRIKRAEFKRGAASVRVAK